MYVSNRNVPQAYLTILFFDERFNLIAAADGGVAQQAVATTWSTSTPALGLVNIKAPKNGYAYVYVSNRSDQPVYFDNLVVNVTTGNIIEENHYYAFGLKITGISSRKLPDANEGNIKNNYLYNDKELFDDGDLDWYDYGFRNYDPQIGRFMQLDPLTWDYEDLTPYQFAGNDPIANVDVDGLEPANVVSFVKSLGEDVSVSVRFITTGTGAGKWAVSWTDGLVAHAMLIKDVAPAVNNTMRFVGLAIKVSQVLNKVATNPPTGDGDKYQAYLVLISSRGALDAHAHAISFGLAGWDHGDDYNTDVEKKAYYRGRIAGDLATSVTSTSEIEGGLTGAVVTSETGVGLLVGGGVALHGAISGGIAAHDLSVSVKKLYMLSKASNSSSDVSNSDNKKFDNSSNNNTNTSNSNKTIVEEKQASNTYDKMDKQQKKMVDDAINKLRNGEAGGNQHNLTGDLKGYKAIDLKGSGKGRGALRIVYKENVNEIIIHSIQDYH